MRKSPVQQRWPQRLRLRSDWVLYQNYYTTRDYSNDGGAAITSDPTYIPSEPLFDGHPAVVFGIASPSHPRFEMIDLTTGQYRAVGVGTISGQVADTVVYDQSANLLIAQDIWGALYVLNLHGAREGVWGGAGWINEPSPILGQDMSFDPKTQRILAIGGGGTTLGMFTDM